MSALMLAAEKNRIAICRDILAKGAVLDAKCDGGRNALMKATEAGNTDVAH